LIAAGVRITWASALFDVKTGTDRVKGDYGPRYRANPQKIAFA
jgi:hypothetical protein